MAKLNKIIIAIFLILILLGTRFFWNIQYNITQIKEQYISEVKEYLEKKYSETMIVADEVVIGDEKSVQAYPIKNPELVFFVRKGDIMMDTYLYETLRFEAELLLKDTFLQYEPEIYVSELKWVNPTMDGKFETFSYLDGLYENLGRLPSWKDVKEYQKIEYAKVNINSNVFDEIHILESVERIKENGCHIENLQIIDKPGEIYKYTF